MTQGAKNVYKIRKNDVGEEAGVKDQVFKKKNQESSTCYCACPVMRLPIPKANSPALVTRAKHEGV